MPHGHSEPSHKTPASVAAAADSLHSATASTATAESSAAPAPDVITETGAVKETSVVSASDNAGDTAAAAAPVSSGRGSRRPSLNNDHSTQVRALRGTSIARLSSFSLACLSFRLYIPCARTVHLSTDAFICCSF